MQVFNILRGQGPGEDMFQNIVCACPRKELERITRVYHPLDVRKALQNARNKEKEALSSDEQPATGMVEKMMDLTGGLVDLTAEPIAAKKVPKKIKKKSLWAQYLMKVISGNYQRTKTHLLRKLVVPRLEMEPKP